MLRDLSRRLVVVLGEDPISKENQKNVCRYIDKPIDRQRERDG